MKTEDENLLFVCEEYLSCSKTTLQKQTGCQWFSADRIITHFPTDCGEFDTRQE